MSYLWLPIEQSPLEREHLRRSNLLALVFFWLNLPLFVAVAWANDTGPRLALALTALVLAGPTVAQLTFDNRRYVSVVHGITAMCLGGLLVHFGQGPLQIEMHFYFFSLLAVLALFGNPMVVVAAAVTVTLHHTVVWMLIPDSVFNHDATWFTVAVHAAFVVVESAAAIYLARSFFDNVIGLEKIVAERTSALSNANASMARVLQHVNQGLLTVDRDGLLEAQRSACADRWLGDLQAGAPFSDQIRAVDPNAAEWLDMGWEDLRDAIMPMEVILDQLPKHLVDGERHLALEYIPIHGDDGGFERMLVVMSDVSAEVASAHAEAERQQLLALLEAMMEDRDGVLDFATDCGHTVEQLVARAWPDLGTCFRWLHTIKGNALTLGLDAFGRTVHELEGVLAEDRREPTPDEIHQVQEAWRHVADAVERLGGDQGADNVVVAPQVLLKLHAAITAGEDPEVLIGLLDRVLGAPLAPQLQRLAQHARRIARRLEKPVNVVVSCEDLVAPPGMLDSLWPTMIHVLRNAIDHGLEYADERRAAGKNELGEIRIEAWSDDGGITLAVRDDGRGVDWSKVARLAAREGIDTAERGLSDVLFRDGVSTCDDVTDVSGRGVGLGAVAGVVESHGGTVDVVSPVPGLGTSIVIHVPLHVRRAVA